MSIPVYPFAIQDTALGARLTDIKNAAPLVYGPLVLSANTTLSVRQFLSAVANGLLATTTAGSVTVTMPTAASILAAFPLEAGAQLKFSAGSSATAAGPNVLNIVGNTGFALSNGAAIAIPAQTTRNIVVTCINPTTPLLVINAA